MTTSDFTAARWRKSSSSASTGDCIELAHTETVFGVRDSKNANGPMLTLTSEQGLEFLDAVKNERFSRP